MVVNPDATQHGGKIYVSLDNRLDDLQISSRAEPLDSKPPPLEQFLDFIVELASLTPMQRDVVMFRLLHDLGRASYPYSRIARLHGRSAQAVEQAHRKAIEASPILQRVFAWKSRPANNSLTGREPAAGEAYREGTRSGLGDHHAT